ncbi:ArsR/SmtB family transcription factor [Longilinea arvoryzae]|nr:winged helix-turn-helix domain-containing protein [Longilinea arvoryzae]
MNDEPLSSYTIRDLDTLRVLSDPLRTQIFDLCAMQPRTVREIAGHLNLAPTRLYYHINLLEKHGLILVDETRRVGNLIEKRYRAVAPTLEIDANLFAIETHQGKENVTTLVRSTLDSARDDLLRSLEARPKTHDPDATPVEREMVLFRLHAYLNDEQAAEFSQRLKTLVDDFNQAGIPGEQTYGLAVAYYPVFYYTGDAAGSSAGPADGEEGPQS